MKKSKIFIAACFLTVLAVGTSACGQSSTHQPPAKNQATPDHSVQSSDDPSQSKGSTTDAESEPSSTNYEHKPTSSAGNNESTETLAQYSVKEIEYARVWLQLGANQNIEGLYVRHISAGTPLNPDDTTSANYPEDVIQLAGSRLVDGSVTYHSNGDGTINVYNVPLRWDGQYPAGKKFYTAITKNTKHVFIDTGDNKKVIEFIKLLK